MIDVRVSGSTWHPTCHAWVSKRAIPFHGLADLLMQLDDRGAPRSVRDVTRYLERATIRYGRPGTYESLRMMVENSGMKISTIRLALVWLVNHGFLAREEVARGNHKVIMYWCLWKVAPAPEAKPPIFTERALFMGHGARIFGAKASKRIPFERKTTTEAESLSSAAHRGDEDGGTQAAETGSSAPAAAPSIIQTPAAPANPVPASAASDPAEPPMPALDPMIAAVIEAEVPDEADRDELAARVPDWLTRATVEMVVKIILEAAAAKRNRAGTSSPVHSLVAFAGGILGFARRDGKVTLRQARSKLPPSGKTAEMARVERETEAARDREKVQAEREAEAREAHLKARWQALPEPEKHAIRAEYDRDHPETMSLPPRSRETVRNMGCIEILGRQQELPS